MPPFLQNALLSALLACAAVGHAAAPWCGAYNGNNYCQYQGQVARAYVNNYDQIILYFDAPMTTADASKVGASVTDACIVSTSTTQGERFGKLFYGTLLSAQATRRKIVVQMNPPAVEGYPRCDRVWISRSTQTKRNT